MTNATQTRKTDPLEAFKAGVFAGPDRTPVPLEATRFDVEIASGLAIVTTVRVFHNHEDASIEAVMTFPVPIHAALFKLAATIDGRRLEGVARSKSHARRAYETAIDEGHAAVLHEEVLKGVHTLAIAHIAPGTRVEVETVWTVNLGFAADRAFLRIPLTVGDIYGRSALNDADDLLSNGPAGRADLDIRCDQGTVTVLGVDLVGGRGEVSLGAPIDIHVSGYVAREIHGLTANGKGVDLTITPATSGDDALSVAVVVDRSGSMGGIVSSRTASAISQHQAVVEALRDLARSVRRSDLVDLWEFDHGVGHIGLMRHGDDRALLRLVDQLGPPQGGTEIGAALAAVLGGSEARDILLITDGKSHNLDIAVLARAGRRITVLLVGEDGLSANVGHLAALTGGDICVAAGDEVGSFLRATVELLRCPATSIARIARLPDAATFIRSGMEVRATWGESRAGGERSAVAHAAAAFAASLVIPALRASTASDLAAAEGLVTHLTSLVLVDETATAAKSRLMLRKIALPMSDINTMQFSCGMSKRAGVNMADAAFSEPSSAAQSPWLTPGDQADAVEDSKWSSFLRQSFSRGRAASGPLSARAGLATAPLASPPNRGDLVLGVDPASGSTVHLRFGRDGIYVERDGADPKVAFLPAGFDPHSIVLADALTLLAGKRWREPPPGPLRTCFLAAYRINWDLDPNALARGDLHSLDGEDIDLVRRLASAPSIEAFAKKHGVDPVILILATIAHLNTDDRSAARLSRHLGLEDLSDTVIALIGAIG